MSKNTTEGTATTRRPTLRAQQKEMTRQKLVDAAVSLFEEKGYPSTTVEDITNRANVSRATFYLHFETKQDIAIANGDRLINRISRLFPLLSTADAVTPKIAHTFLDEATEILHEQAQENIVAIAANVADPKLMVKGWADYHALGDQLLAAFLQDGWEQLDPKAATSFALMFPMLTYSLWSEGIYHLDAPSSSFRDALADIVVGIIDAAVRRPL